MNAGIVSLITSVMSELKKIEEKTPPATNLLSLNLFLCPWNLSLYMALRYEWKNHSNIFKISLN